MDFVVRPNPSSPSVRSSSYHFQETTTCGSTKKGILECLTERRSASSALIYDGIIITSVHSCSNIGLMRDRPYLHMPSSYGLCQRYRSH